MDFIKAAKYRDKKYMDLIMGPNPLKLTEELLNGCKIKKNAVVCDLGSGEGLTSAFIAKEYGFKVYAADLWSEPESHVPFFKSFGLSDNEIVPVKADATDLPFEKEFFDAIISIDAYNYFGRSEGFLDEKILPFLKRGGYVYLAIPGMKKNLHDNLPEELLVSWTKEQLEYMLDVKYWKTLLGKSKDGELISITEMDCTESAWKDWVVQDNDYARGDKKAVDAGALKYLNTIAAVIKKR